MAALMSQACIAAFDSMACAPCTAPHRVFCNAPCRGDFGRLGHGDGNDVFMPKQIAFFSGRSVKTMACGDTHTLVITHDGAAYSFGRNQHGQLGHGSTMDMLSPRHIAALEVRVLITGLLSQHVPSVLYAGPLMSCSVLAYSACCIGRCLSCASGHMQEQSSLAAAVHSDGSDASASHVWSCCKRPLHCHDNGRGKQSNHWLCCAQGKAVRSVAAGAEHTVAATEDGEVGAM